jgi:hypothetical protein
MTRRAAPAPGCCIPTSRPTARARCRTSRWRRRGAGRMRCPGWRCSGAESCACPAASRRAFRVKASSRSWPQRFKAEEIELVLIDGPVTPVQQRNLEKAWKVKLLDRTGPDPRDLSDRARTREGVLQVEMAALSYQRTRLVRAWTHLERQRGGLGSWAARARPRSRPTAAPSTNSWCACAASSTRWSRPAPCTGPRGRKVPFPIVALVGYTNAGKSTLFNRLTGAEVMAKDMLFATLDPTMRADRAARRARGDPVGHGGVHLGPADRAGRRLPRHAGRGAGRRSDRACARYLPSRDRGTGRGCRRPSSPSLA